MALDFTMWTDPEYWMHLTHLTAAGCTFYKDTTNVTMKVSV